VSEPSRYERLFRLGVELSAEKDRHRLVERILLGAKDFCKADGGTLYTFDEDAQLLNFELVRNDTLGFAFRAKESSEAPMPPVRLSDPETGAPNHANIASHCALVRESVNVPDAYRADGFDFSGTKAFDARNGYRSQSFLTIPMVNGEDRLIGVLQLINARDERGNTVAFSSEAQQAVEALASQAAVALDNLILLNQQKALLKSFIDLIAEAIDAKSAHTGGHCARVPVLTEMLTEAVCATREGPLADFDLDEEGWYELRIASGLHDCGKITTPVHVMDKSTKLETIFDRIELVHARFAVLRQMLLRERAERRLAGERGEDVERDVEVRLAQLEEDRRFLQHANIGGERMDEADRARVSALATRAWEDAEGTRQPLLGPEEVEHLRIAKGTLTDDERIIINGHMVQTIRMLESLPFPRNLRRVPEYAGGHHEKMDGTGYPKGLYAGDMSIPARIMAVADVFEALTASDRPYKPGMPLSRAMQIMGDMKTKNHLDPELFDVFVKSGTYRRYAEMFLDPSLIDEVDEAALLALRPGELELPPPEARAERWKGFLPRYEAMFPDPKRHER
jgi:HD-GYP domain-containing protein (c-di-GMP phosphodiesterase class II)